MTTCDDSSPAARNQIEELRTKSHCSHLLTPMDDFKKAEDLAKSERHSMQSERHSMLERRQYRKDRRTAIKQRIRKSAEFTSTVILRSKSDETSTRKKGGLLDMVAGLTGRNSSVARQETEDLRELADFSVKPYYNDYSDHSTILIPPSLQVKESK